MMDNLTLIEQMDQMLGDVVQGNRNTHVQIQYCIGKFRRQIRRERQEAESEKIEAVSGKQED
jgi:hypothetical protein